MSSFTYLCPAMAAAHAGPRSRFYSSVMVTPGNRAFRNATDDGETEIIGHPSYWRGLRGHPDVSVTDSSLPDPFSIPVIDLDVEPNLRRRVLGPIFNRTLEAA